MRPTISVLVSLTTAVVAQRPPLPRWCVLYQVSLPLLTVNHGARDQRAGLLSFQPTTHRPTFVSTKVLRDNSCTRLGKFQRKSPSLKGLLNTRGFDIFPAATMPPLLFQLEKIWKYFPNMRSCVFTTSTPRVANSPVNQGPSKARCSSLP